ncbi:MAG: glycosyltransferase family 4 protein [Sedimentisphaerales bacterium]|nr:glycosyltransferase family 4 protein [Sedimentisphaerales bacterium]
MKVLWLTNMLMPAHAHAVGLVPSPRGGWMPSLAEALVEDGQVELGVATNIFDRREENMMIKGMRYYTIPCSKSSIRGGHMPVSLIQAYQNAVKDFSPDVIHIHGTENFQGLLTARGHINCPTVISIQGILDVVRRYYWGGMSLFEILTTRTLRDWVRMDGLIEQQLRVTKRAVFEREVFARNSAFIGRTIWDQAHTRRLNPNARYYHCDEMIRRPFFNGQWNIGKIKRHSIFASSASYPLKGFHVLIKAVALLHKEFPDITLRSPLANLYPKLSGVKRFWKYCRVGGYARYLNGLIRAERLENNIVPLPILDAQGMTNELVKAHVFVLPSLIENSPNSLAEAMLVSTPSVASFVGGVPSMVRDGETGLFFPPGDEAILAEQIRRVFLDDQLALELSSKAHDVARRRYCRKKIVTDMIDIYNTVALL